tara:strand:- start:84 stop:500 length:417 start_codon:yes stop_codon:yes gene_type:complete
MNLVYAQQGRQTLDLIVGFKISPILWKHIVSNTKILDNPNIEKAVLMDPINLPWVSFDGFTNSVINLDYPVYIIKSGKLYSGSKTLAQYQDPDFKNDVQTLVYDDVGHPDILDNTWANIASTIGIWEMAEGEKMNYSN